MITAIEGTLESRGLEWAVVKVGGVSLQIHLSSFSVGRLGPVGDRVCLCTHLYWKEDSVALYGFTSQQELDLFKLLIGVNGVGPRLALTMLSGMECGQLAVAIASGNVELLVQIPGLGKKMAGRLVLELKSKLAKDLVGVSMYAGEDSNELTAVLTNLGYSAAEIARAVAEIPPSSDLSLEDKTKLALRYLGR